MKNLIFPTIPENYPFFFGLKFYSNQRVCESVHNICLQYSENAVPFAIVKNKDNQTMALAKECSQQDFYIVDQNTLYYKNKYVIYLEPRYCTCAWFLEFVMCKHHVAACIVTNHIDSHDREVIITRGRSRPKKGKGALTK